MSGGGTADLSGVEGLSAEKQAEAGEGASVVVVGGGTIGAGEDRHLARHPFFDAIWIATSRAQPGHP